MPSNANSRSAEQERQDAFIVQAMARFAQREFQREDRRRRRRNIGWTLVFMVIFGGAVWLAMLAFQQ